VVRCRIAVWKCGPERLAVVLVVVVGSPLDMTAGTDTIQVVEVLLSILEAMIVTWALDELILAEG